MSISREQALDCLASDDLIGIGMEADAVRRRLHPEAVVTYTVNTRIDIAQPVAAHVEAALEAGATGVVLETREPLSLEPLEATIKTIKTIKTIREADASVQIQALCATKILRLSDAAGLSCEEVLTRLKTAGLDTIGGGGAAPGAAGPWLAVHRAAHQAGILTTAEMVFGAGEAIEERVSFLEALRTLQEETGGFVAFALTAAASATGRELDDPTAVEYLKTLAVCRMVVDNIPNLQTNAHQQGLKVLQMSLRFGGNDAGAVQPIAESRHSQDASEEEIRRIIRDAGFRPSRRDSLYRTSFLN